MNKFKNIIDSIMSLSRFLKACFVMLILHVFVYKLVLCNYEAANHIVFELGVIFYDIALALLCSIIFFFFQIHIPEQRNKKRLYPAISNLYRDFINAQRNIVSVAIKHADPTIKSEEEKILDGNTKIPYTEFSDRKYLGVTKDILWIEVLYNEVLIIEKYRQDILALSQYIDSQGLSFALNVIYHPEIKTINALYKTWTQDTKRGIRFYNSRKDRMMLDFWTFIQEEEKYFEDTFGKYI